MAAYSTNPANEIFFRPDTANGLNLSNVIPILTSQSRLDWGIEGVSGKPQKLNHCIKWFQANVQDAQLAIYCQSGNTILTLYAFNVLSSRNVKLAMAVLDSNIANTKEFEYGSGCYGGRDCFNVYCYKLLKRNMSKPDKQKYRDLISRFYSKEKWATIARTDVFE